MIRLTADMITDMMMFIITLSSEPTFQLLRKNTPMKVRASTIAVMVKVSNFREDFSQSFTPMLVQMMS